MTDLDKLFTKLLDDVIELLSEPVPESESCDPEPTPEPEPEFKPINNNVRPEIHRVATRRVIFYYDQYVTGSRDHSPNTYIVAQDNLYQYGSLLGHITKYSVVDGEYEFEYWKS